MKEKKKERRINTKNIFVQSRPNSSRGFELGVEEAYMGGERLFVNTTCPFLISETTGD